MKTFLSVLAALAVLAGCATKESIRASAPYYSESFQAGYLELAKCAQVGWDAEFYGSINRIEDSVNRRAILQIGESFPSRAADEGSFSDLGDGVTLFEFRRGPTIPDPPEWVIGAVQRCAAVLNQPN